LRDGILELGRISDVIIDVLELCTTLSEVEYVSKHVISLGRKAASWQLEEPSAAQ